MSVVLAVEPDSTQAEILRKAVRRIDSEFMVVSTTRAAISAMGKSVPDLILVSALLSPRDEDALRAHLRSLAGSSHVQTLTIPQLRRGKESSKKTAAIGRFRKKTAAPGSAGCDPAVFAEQVSGYLARAREAQTQFAEMALARAHEQSKAAWRSVLQSIPPVEVEPRVESGPPTLRELLGAIEQPLVAIEPRSVGIEQPLAAIEQPAAIGEPVVAEAVPDVAPYESVFTADAAGYDAPLKPRGAAEQPPTTRGDDSWIDLDVDAPAQEHIEPERLETLETRLTAEVETPLTAEEVRSQLSAEVARFEEKAQQREAELVKAQSEAQARLAAEVERVQAEAEDRRQHELARVLAEAEAQRHAAVTEARATAESEARSVLLAELEQVRLSEIARVQAEADERCDNAARQAREAAEAEAGRAMAAELTRIREQVEQTLNHQLAQARADAEKMRLAEMERVHAEAAALRDTAAREARMAAEAAASRALEVEVARVRADAEARLQLELDTIRREAEHLRRADQSEASQAAEKVQAAAVRDARAIAEAANQTLEAELVRVRAEADARLEAELARARTQAERQRTTELEEIRTQVAEMRETASQQARRAAAQAIAAEVVRGGVENEVAPAAVSPARRSAGPRRSVGRTRPVEPIRPAEPAYAVEAIRAVEAMRVVEAMRGVGTPPAVERTPAIETPPAVEAMRAIEAQPAATSPGNYYSLWTSPAEPAAESLADQDSSIIPKSLGALIRSKWALPVAAAILLVVGNGISVGWSWRSRLSDPKPAGSVVPRHAAAPVAGAGMVKTGQLRVETAPPGVRVLLDGAPAGRTPLTIAKLKPGRYTLVLEGSEGTLTRKVAVRAGETERVVENIFSGWLAVFAGIPLNIYVGGRLRGTTEDGQLMLTAGSHDVELVSERFNYRETKSLTIVPGQVVSYSVSLPTSVIRINSPDGTDISIDGRATGRTPLGDLRVPIGAHEVVGTSAELGQLRQSIEVKLGESAEVTLK